MAEINDPLAATSKFLQSAVPQFALDQIGVRHVSSLASGSTRWRGYPTDQEWQWSALTAGTRGLCQRAVKTSQGAKLKSSHFEWRGIRRGVASTTQLLTEAPHGE